MKRKGITVSINSTYKFLQVWNGIFDLTNKELFRSGVDEYK